MKTQKLFGWLYLPLVVLLGLVLYQPAKQWADAGNRAEALTLQTVPVEPFQQLFDEHAAMRHRAMPNEKPASDPLAYYRFIMERDEWELRARKYADLNWRDLRERNILTTLMEGSWRTVSEINQDYQTAFGIHRMQEVADEFWKTHTAHPREVHANYGQLWLAVRMAYLPTALIWALGLLLWCQRRGMNVWVEVPRIIMASFAPIVSLVVYPVRIDQTRQVKSALEFACWAAMAVFSFGTTAGSLAKAQTGPFGKKGGIEETKKKRRRGTVTFSTGISSESPSSISGSVFSPAPNLQSTVKVALDNGWYGSITQWWSLDNANPNANIGDWLLGVVGYSRKFRAVTVTAEELHMAAAPFEIGCGDYTTVRGTISYALGKDGRQGSVYGTAREMWKLAKGYTDSGTYGYLGYNRNVKVPGLPIPIATSTEFRLDPGNIGRGAAVGLAERAEIPIAVPKTRWVLRPFVGTQGPLWKERPTARDNRSWELFGGLQFAFSTRI